MSAKTFGEKGGRDRLSVENPPKMQQTCDDYNVLVLVHPYESAKKIRDQKWRCPHL